MIAPLDVYPEAVRDLILWTPFPYFVYFPAAIIIGLPVDFLRGLLIISGWGIFFWVLNRWLWRKGLKHYSGMGA